MSRTLIRIAMYAAGFVLLAFAVLMVNQTVQIVHQAEMIHPTLGRVVLWSLLVAYSVMLLVPLVLFLRLPPPLKPPTDTAAPEFSAYLERLRHRLRRSEYLTGRHLETVQDVEAALRLLDQRANELIERTAATVFVSTAVSQSGKLDGLLVLSAQTRMVWQVAWLYWQRPTLRDMAYLYANVAGTAFMAGEIDDVDLSEQVAPLVTAAVGGTVGAIPGFQAVVAVLTTSLLTGSANAYLTLRVGVIARRYCSSLVALDRRGVRRGAATEAAGMLLTVARTCATRITKAVWARSSGPVAQVAQAAAERVTALGRGVQSTSGDMASAVGQAVADAFSWLRSRAGRSTDT